MTRRSSCAGRVRRLTLFAGAVILGVTSLRAQSVGTVQATASAVGEGGPDVSHLREDSLEGFAIGGRLGAFGDAGAFHLEASGLGSPDFRVRSAFFQKDLILEFSGIQRSYLVGGDARFAWDPQAGVLDGRVSGTLAQYRPYPGSPVGHFDPNNLTRARSVLPEGSPGWSLLEGHIGVRTTDRPTGFEVALDWTRRQGVFPRTFVTATGFTPILSPLTVGLPVGNPLGVVEVPDRLDERSTALLVRAFTQRGTWRWEGSARVEGFVQDRPVDSWVSPFPGPGIRQPRSFEGYSSRFRLEGKGPELRVRLEYMTRRGEGEAGRRTVEDGRAAIEWGRTRGGATTFLHAYGLVRRDRAEILPQGPHPVFAGPFYDLSGPYAAQSGAFSRPLREARLEGGVRGRRWEVSANLRDRRSDEAFAKRSVTLEGNFRWTPCAGISLSLKPFWTRASQMNPSADALGPGGGWNQAVGFLPIEARNWRGATASARFVKGIWFFQYAGSQVTSPPDLGLRTRTFNDFAAGIRAESGPWKILASLRQSSSALALDATTYARPGDPTDPSDPSHRLPMSERWERCGGSLQVEAERSWEGGHGIGFRGRYEDQRLHTRGILDDGRSYRYGRYGLFGRLQKGQVCWEVEFGGETYHGRDPAFLPPDPPPGPFLWAGLTERPGARAFARVTCAVQF